MGACDVAAVAAVIRTGIDQQRAMSGRTMTLQDLIVQHRACLIQRDDSVVGQLLLALPAGADESLVDVVLAAACGEAGRCRLVTAESDPIGHGEALDLVCSLTSASVVEATQQTVRIDCCEPVAAELGQRISKPCGPRQIPRQGRACLLRRVDDHHVEGFYPSSLRHRRRLVPKVGCDEENQLRPRSRAVIHQRAWGVLERRPPFEIRMGLVGVVLIVARKTERFARLEYHPVEPSAGERPIGSRAQFGDMSREKSVW